MSTDTLPLTAADPVTTVQVAVATLEDRLPDLVAACTSPDAADLAELLADVQAARTALAGLERDLETQLGRAMLSDLVETPGLRVERRRGSDRKAWDHDGWRRDVQQQLLRKHGLLGAQVFITADGEEVPAKGVLGGLIAEAYDVQGKKEPTTTGLKALGLDARDYCETSPGAVRVTVTRLAGENLED